MQFENQISELDLQISQNNEQIRQLQLLLASKPAKQLPPVHAALHRNLQYKLSYYNSLSSPLLLNVSSPSQCIQILDEQLQIQPQCKYFFQKTPTSSSSSGSPTKSCKTSEKITSPPKSTEVPSEPSLGLKAEATRKK